MYEENFFKNNYFKMHHYCRSWLVLINEFKIDFVQGMVN